MILGVTFASIYRNFPFNKYFKNNYFIHGKTRNHRKKLPRFNLPRIGFLIPPGLGNSCSKKRTRAVVDFPNDSGLGLLD